MPSPQLTDLVTYLHTSLLVNRFPATEQGGIYRASERPIRRIGLALEPTPLLADWVRSEQLDALWLHRPWHLPLNQLPSDVGVIYHHLPFDEHLTTGLNPLLADRMTMINVEELGHKQSADERGLPMSPRPIGMLGDALVRPFGDWESFVECQFGGFDRSEPGLDPMPMRVAVVGAMNAALVQEAHERGVSLYLTGEYRTGTQKAVEETGMAVIAIGHRRTEEWGLRALRRLLRIKWTELDVAVLTAAGSA